MFPKMLTSAIGAGCAAWLLAAVLHFAFVQKYILLGEEYESGAMVHFGGAAPPAEAAATDAHSHDDATAEEGHTHDAVEEEGHSHDGAEAGHSHGGGEVSTFTRDLWTTVFFGLVYVAYALILVAGFGLARVYGKVITAREGLLWGIAGFAAFQLAPAMGLAPELPGTLAARPATSRAQAKRRRLAARRKSKGCARIRGLPSEIMAVLQSHFAPAHSVGRQKIFAPRSSAALAPSACWQRPWRLCQPRFCGAKAARPVALG